MIDSFFQRWILSLKCPFFQFLHPFFNPGRNRIKIILRNTVSCQNFLCKQILMPKFGEVMEEGTLIEWKKKEGDAVEKGEVVLEIETDKANTDVESTATGIIQQILVQEGQTVAVNTPLALIDE